MSNKIYDFSFYIALSNPYVRLILVLNNKVWDVANSVLAWGTTYGDTDIQLTADTDAVNVPFAIPADLPAGEYDCILYDAASPSSSDTPKLGKRIRWNGTKLSGLPIDL